jgi:ABC-type transport system involved in cytochrome c biogenesis permease subunit
LIFTAWSTVLIYLLVGSAYRLSLLGAFTTPLVLVMLLTAELAPLDRTPHLRAIRDPWIEFHASLSLIAYGAFALAGLAGIMYLLQDRQLKNRRGGTLLYNLPPITDLAIANTRLIWLGLGLLTIAFAAGFVSGMQVNTIKFWTSATIWLAYALMVGLRQVHTLAPRRTAMLSIVALVFIFVTLPVIQHLSASKVTILCAGINHRDAALEIREKFAIGNHELQETLDTLRAIEGLCGAVVVSTCNRVELYASSMNPLAVMDGIRRFLKVSHEWS